MERVNSVKKIRKKGALCGLVESKDSKTMLLLFLHSSCRKKKAPGSKPEVECTGNKKTLYLYRYFSIT